jgi:copper transport protein
VRRARLIAVALGLLALAAAPAASAHSVLIATEPARDAVVEQSPDQVLLRFDEPVETALGSIRVFDGSGQRVDAEEILRPSPEEVAVRIEDELDRGTYTVAWRAISADSDPINGAFVFHVGAPGPQPSGIAAEVLEGAPAAVSVAFTGGRFFEFALMLLAAGGLAAIALTLGSCRRDVRARLYGLVAVLAGLLAVMALLGIVFQGAAAGGFGLGEAFSWNVFSSVVDTRYGQVELIRAALAAALALTALALIRETGRPERTLLVVALVLVAGILVTPSFGGHASTGGPVAMVADVAHIQAAATWTGGLAFVVLALLLSRSERWTPAARCVPRFSTMAVVSVAVLLIAGAVNGYLQVRTWSGLWETEYGLLLLAKIALVLPLLALGAYNNRYSVPRLRAQIASVAERRRFLRAAGTELVIMVAIVAVTAVLVNAPPARTEVVMHGPESVTVELGDVEAHVEVDPAMPGENEIHLEFMGADGAPAEIAEVNIAASLPSAEIGPLRFAAEPGHEHGSFVVMAADFPLAGEWELRIEARRGEFELLTETTTISIREES